MDKYIDREAVLHALHEIGGCDAPPDTWANGFDKAIDEAYRSVQRLPAADVAPVVHGRWEWDTEDIYRCTVCNEKAHVKEVMGQPDWHYCPNCGAKMDGGVYAEG